MNPVKAFSKKLTEAKWFDLSITTIIIINSLLIGVETYVTNDIITLIQNVILGIFTLEIILRFIAADSIKEFFKGGWNNFDLILVLIGYIPTSMIANASMLMALRVLRVFRVLRLLRAAKEIKIMITVLIKSMSALFYNIVLFVIFVYLFAIIGVSVFRLPDPNTLNQEQAVKYEQLMQVAPNAPTCSPDPYGTLDEAMFTLFRALTGEDWTDLRYNLVVASEYDLIHVSPTFVTSFHVLWFILSAFLLLNLVVGAIVNNYQLAIDETNKEESETVDSK
jgi:voltage-gated sodium channel